MSTRTSTRTLDVVSDRQSALRRLTRGAMAALLDQLEEASSSSAFDRAIFAFDSNGRRIGAPKPHHMKVRDDGHLARRAGLRGDSDAPVLVFDSDTLLDADEIAAERAGAAMPGREAAASLGLTFRQFRRRIDNARRKLRLAGERAIERAEVDRRGF